MGYNPFCQYYHQNKILPPRKESKGIQSFFSVPQEQKIIRVHECHHPDNLDSAGHLHNESWTCDQKFSCPFKKFSPK